MADEVNVEQESVEETPSEVGGEDKGFEDFEKLLTGGEESEENLEEESSEVVDKEVDEEGDEGVEIPEAPYNQAKGLGYSDEQIAEIYSHNPEAFSKLFKEEAKEVLDEEVKEEEKEEPLISDEELKKLEKSGNKEAVELIKKLTGSLASVQGKMKAYEEGAEKATLKRNAFTASDMFDKIADKYPELGKTDDLMKNRNDAAVSLRNQLFGRAEQLCNAGMYDNFAAAMEDSITWYKGRQGESRIHQKIITDLNGQKKIFLAKPAGKKTTKKVEGTAESKVLNVLKENLG